MILLPVLGLVAGLALARPLAFAITIVGAVAGFGLAAALTDEEIGWWDPFVWIDTVAALAATTLGIWLRRRYASRRGPFRAAHQ